MGGGCMLKGQQSDSKQLNMPNAKLQTKHEWNRRYDPLPP